ncbi:MAG: DUF1585 domain-containing protein [Candidatus Omnitrophica bacterium]|nr:DUF1585 domain-containing protein [Candidatus Omnitrophota bacterium]
MKKPLSLLCLLLSFLGALNDFAFAQEFVQLSNPETIRRISLDLKGTLPSESDLQADDFGISTLIDQYMTSEEFNNRLLWMGNDIFLTRNTFVEYFRDSYDYENEESRWDVTKAVGEEPVRLFQYIVKNDLPLTELVAADYTVANSTLSWFWNISYDGNEYSDQWRKGRYLDGREHAGVLSQTSFYFRYPSTLSNKQRHRANQITRIFLDDDHLLRDVSVDLRLGAADPELNLLDATVHNVGCVACHSTLDGIGAHLYGFSIGPEGSSSYAKETFTTFSKQGMKSAQLHLNRNPSYYGYPSSGLKDLGNYIAKDPRFARTMAKHIYKFLLHRDMDYRDRDLLNSLGTFLKDNNYSTKALIKHILLSDEYQAVGVPSSGQKGKEEIAPSDNKIPKDLSQKFRDLKDKIAAAEGISDGSREQFEKVFWIHAVETGYSQRVASAKTPVQDQKGLGANPTTVEPPAPEEIIQPFKLLTPEQLHTLGKDLVGEIWNGYEGGQWMPAPFPHLEYNTDVKIAAGGYDGERVLERRWDVPPTYLLVLERWAEVLAEDILDHELGESVHWSQRKVFTLITGRENPYEAEPMIRNQIADWFKRFYAEEVDPWSPEVDDVFGVFLTAREAAREDFGDWYNTEVAWSHVLGMLLSDPRIALY